MSEEIQEDFSVYEDDIIKLLSKLSETIESFNNLSREKAENAILETNIKISSCKEILDKMEQYIQNSKEMEENEKVELNKKFLNYKSEYHDILNKFQEIQDNYINKKTANALIDEPNPSELIENDETNNKNEGTAPKGVGEGERQQTDESLKDTTKNNKEIKTQIFQKKDSNNVNTAIKGDPKEVNNNKKSNDAMLISVTNNETSILEQNKSNIIGDVLNNPNKEKEEPFNQINQEYELKKKRTIWICSSLFIFAFFSLFLIIFLSR